MDPVMVEIGPLAIRCYGGCLTLAIFLGYELARRRLRAWGWDLEPFERVVFWAVVFGVVGARLGYVLTSPGYFLENPLEALYIWHGGLSFHGAILGGRIHRVGFVRRGVRGRVLPIFLGGQMAPG